MPRVPAKQRRQDFIRAATKVIAEHGVDGATTRRIAAAAGAPLASLHYTFHSKEELFFAIQEEQLGLLEQRDLQVSPDVGLGKTAAEMLRLVMEWLTDQDEFTRATLELQLWAHRLDPSLAIRSYDVHLNSIMASLRKAATSEDADELVEALGRMIASAADGLSIQWLTYRDSRRLATDVALWGAALERLVHEHRRPRGKPRQAQAADVG